jgi:ribosomal-protein-alanine N-acetyltransferase
MEIPGQKRSFPILTTNRLLLREFSLEDIPTVFEMLRRDDINEWLESDPMKSIEEAEARVRGRMGLFTDKMGIRWAITQRTEPERVIGSCGYFSVRRGTATVETGYEIHPDFWKHGLMTEALQSMIQFSFGAQDLMPVHRIEALVSPGKALSGYWRSLVFTRKDCGANSAFGRAATRMSFYMLCLIPMIDKHPPQSGRNHVQSTAAEA